MSAFFSSRIDQSYGDGFSRDSQPVDLVDPNATIKLRKVGKGGNGKCYLVKRYRDRKLLIKKINSSSKTTGLERRFLEHVLPSHRRIVNLEPQSQSPTDGALYFEYCRGGDLDTLIGKFEKDQKYIPETFIWHVFHQLAEALAFIHFGYDKHHPHDHPSKWQRIIHRDIKPTNVFLRTKYSDHPPFASIVLGDFGSATTKHTSNSFTTLKYQPPEIPKCTAEGDVWGLGAVIHDLVHGHPPFREPNDLQYLLNGGFRAWAKKSKAHRPKEAPLRYSADLNEAMMDTLALKARHRPTSLELFRVLNDREGD